MSTAAQSVRQLIEALLPSEWKVQLGTWSDASKQDRCAVIRPVGGLPVELIRSPQFVITMVGRDNDPRDEFSEVVDGVIRGLSQSSGDLVFVQPSEASFVLSGDGRPIFEFALSAIASLQGA